ncbi:MAG: DUF366 family protein [Methanobacteriaceae archaeon]|nr:DUF366 family protein [Methanobacteriaceae archaeon]
MQYVTGNNGQEYDGSQIEPSWAFQEFNIKDSTIVAWTGPMNIHNDNLIDYEDIGLDIKGNQMLHFIVEHFDIQPGNIKIAYLRQRILVMITQDILRKYNISTKRKGDDIFIGHGKLSVSIATASISSIKIHFALNITKQGTPDDVKTSALEDNNLTKIEINKIKEEIAKNYIEEIETIEQDITKTRVF